MQIMKIDEFNWNIWMQKSKHKDDDARSLIITHSKWLWWSISIEAINDSDCCSIIVIYKMEWHKLLCTNAASRRNECLGFHRNETRMWPRPGNCDYFTYFFHFIFFWSLVALMWMVKSNRFLFLANCSCVWQDMKEWRNVLKMINGLST